MNCKLPSKPRMYDLQQTRLARCLEHPFGHSPAFSLSLTVPGPVHHLKHDGPAASKFRKHTCDMSCYAFACVHSCVLYVFRAPCYFPVSVLFSTARNMALQEVSRHGSRYHTVGFLFSLAFGGCPRYILSFSHCHSWKQSATAKSNTSRTCTGEVAFRNSTTTVPT